MEEVEKVAVAPALDVRFRMSGSGAAPTPSLMALPIKEQLLLWIWLVFLCRICFLRAFFFGDGNGFLVIYHLNE